jgi:hypothetical protein
MLTAAFTGLPASELGLRWLISSAAKFTSASERTASKRSGGPSPKPVSARCRSPAVIAAKLAKTAVKVDPKTGKAKNTG